MRIAGDERRKVKAFQETWMAGNELSARVVGKILSKHPPCSAMGYIM